MSTYDIVITRPVKAETTRARVEDEPLRHEGWLVLDGDLQNARRLVQRTLELRGHAYVVPSHYRYPRVTVEQARETAERRRRELGDQGQHLEPFSFNYDDILWWTFVADDPKAIAREVFPGQVHIAVDKLTGQLRTEKQFQEWLALSGFD